MKKKVKPIVKKGKKTELSNEDRLIKKYGKKFFANERKQEFIPTGIPRVDKLFGGGIPRGVYTQISGVPGIGKTTLSLYAIASAQKMGLVCAFIDGERRFTYDYARKIGVDTDKLIVVHPPHLEAMYDYLEVAFREGTINLAVSDSLPSIKARETIEREIDEQERAADAKVHSRCIPRLIDPLYDCNGVWLIINQLRADMTAQANPHYKPMTTPGGEYLKYNATLDVEMWKSENIKEAENIIGTAIKVKVHKGTAGATTATDEKISLVYGEGFDTDLDFVQDCIKKGVIKQEGAWYYLDEEPLGNGLKKVLESLKTSKELRKHLEEKYNA